MGIKNTSEIKLINKKKGVIQSFSEQDTSISKKEISRDFTFQEILDAESVYEGIYDGFAQDLECYIRNHQDTKIIDITYREPGSDMTTGRIPMQGLELNKEFIYNDTTYTFTFWINPKDQKFLKKYPESKLCGMTIKKKKKTTVHLYTSYFNQQSQLKVGGNVLLPPPEEQNTSGSKEGIDLYCKLIGLFRDNHGLIVEDGGFDY